MRQTIGAFAILLCAAPALAQLATASVEVQVQGSTAAGVEVRLLPIRTIGRAWSARSDIHGRIVFPRVDPGSYRLVLPAVDKAAAASQSLQIAPGDVLRIELDAATAAMTIVRRHRAGYRSDFSRSDLHAYAMSGDIWSLIETVEPIALADRINGGGVSTGEPALIGAHASSWTQASFFDGDVDVTSALAGGTPLLYPDGNILRASSIVTADAPIEVAAPGPALVLVPSAPSSFWHWSVHADASPRGRRAPPAGPPSIAALRSWTDGGFSGGGPIGSFAGATFALASTRSTHTERDAGPALPGNVDSASGGFVIAPSNEQELDLRASLQRTEHPFAGRAHLADRFATARDRFTAIRGAWQQGSTSPRWIDVALQSVRTSVAAASLVNGTIERLREPSVPQLQRSNPGTRTRWTIDAGLAPRVGDVDRGRHTFTFGTQLSRSSATASPIGDGPIGEEVDGIPARAWVYTEGTMRPRATTAAVYADDRYRPRSRVSIDTGLRLETFGGSSGGASQRVRFTSVVPRVSVRWRAWKMLTLFGSWRRYADAFPLVDLAFGDPSAPQGSIYRWEDPNGDGIVQQDELGALVARAGPGSARGLSSIDPRLRRPQTDEALAGVEAALPHWNLRIAGIATHERRLIALTDPGAPGAGSVHPAYAVVYVADPGLDLGSPIDDQQLPISARLPATFGQDRYVLTNPPGLNAAFRGVEMTMAGQAGPLQMLVGAAAMRSHGHAASRGFLATDNDQGVVGELFVDPNAATFADGRLFFDAGYSVKWSAAYTGSHGVRAAVAARYQDGQNFARVAIARDLPQGAEAIRAYPDGRSKFTYRFTTDARLEKAFAIGGGRVAAVLEVYNLFNTANEVEENVVTGPAFRTPTALQPPRVVRLGLRVEY